MKCGRLAVLIGVFGVLCPFATQAASFDCAKAGTKVEKMICADAGLSKLDEELGRAYSEARRKSSDSDALKKQQRAWLKERDKCVDRDCLRNEYKERISDLAQLSITSSQQKQAERYELVMSKDDELCNHMLNLFNDDLRKYGWNGDAHQEEHEEFKRVPWKPGRFFNTYGPNKNISFRSIEGAKFDFNNNGNDDFIVRWDAWLSNEQADYLFILSGEKAYLLNNLDFKKDLLNAKNRIRLAGYSYPLSFKKEPMAGLQMIDPRVLEPFIFRGTSYLLMRPLFERYKTRSGYAVIAKYIEGKFVADEKTGKMEDVCYFRRVGDARKD